MVYIEFRARHADWQAEIKTIVREWPPRSQAPDKRLTHMATRHESGISYLTLGELIKIIVAQENWPLFESYFPPKDVFAPRMMEISQIRHRVAHFRDPHPHDLDRAILFLRDLDHGLWRFATSYSGYRTGLSKGVSDPVSEYFDKTHDRRRIVEMRTIDGSWRYAAEAREPRVHFGISYSTRPWFKLAGSSVAGQPGLVYHARFGFLGASGVPIASILESTERVHADCIHVRVDGHSVEITAPSAVGEEPLISTIECFLERSIELASTGLALGASHIERVIAAWPEYVLGPSNPLMFLTDDMPCEIFVLD